MLQLGRIQQPFGEVNYDMGTVKAIDESVRLDTFCKK